MYTVNAKFTGAWVRSGWFDIVVDHGVVAKAYPLDDEARQLALNSGGGLDMFEAPSAVLDRATAPTPTENTGLHLDYTIRRSATGAPLEICWDDPQAADEEGCWDWRHYRDGDVAIAPSPTPSETPNPSPSPAVTVTTDKVTWSEPANYDYVVNYSAFTADAGKYTIQVRDHKVVSAILESVADTGTPRPAPQSWTLGELVALYNKARKGPDSHCEMTVEVGTGVPASIRVDWVKTVADDEQYFSIESFTPEP